jgi:RNA polymerase sigma-70 factor (ECF subfamily)
MRRTLLLRAVNLFGQWPDSFTNGVTSLATRGGDRHQGAVSPDLLERVAQGDAGALERLYQELAPKLYRYLVARGIPDAGAEEVLQETFIAVWRRAGTYRSEAPAEAWVFGIARHKLRDWYRGEGETTPEDSTTAVSGGDPTFEAVRAREILSQLSDEDRELVRLVFVAGFSYGEISALLDIPEGTVKSRVFLMRRRLQKLTRGKSE